MSVLRGKTAKIDNQTSKVLSLFDFDHNAAPMWVFDMSTLAFLAVNDAAVRDYGYSRKEFLSMTILDIRPNEDIVPLLREELHEGRRHNSQKELWRHQNKNGSLIDVEITSCEVLFNGRRAKIVTAVDVTAPFPRTSSE
jgi:two-component system, cell cycle sensor histidine kinase and response regulator CckA